jgi:hypothetical protein
MVRIIVRFFTVDKFWKLARRMTENRRQASGTNRR